MSDDFDEKGAKEALERREQERIERLEQKRVRILSTVTAAIREIFSNRDVEVYLIGSITKPYCFNDRSDVDIVLKNYTGDRFDIWTEIEGKIQHNIQVILFEKSSFQEYIEWEGTRII